MNDKDFKEFDAKLAAEFVVIMRELHDTLSGTISELQLEINKFKEKSAGRHSVFVDKVQACVECLASFKLLINDEPKS